ncbi:hypothetical protein PROFUN_06719 [Planoprotostelium fungivorum]|uniref:SSD domain-containing protein n=1 Tax=Planoprotostelium fungivorum TaxID=1890364 RepID=A0A2P6NG89_9EUKA|nr:hypothetical protein PROFUN_06719 [Planoprotostelium fungivorum]
MDITKSLTLNTAVVGAWHVGWCGLFHPETSERTLELTPVVIAYFNPLWTSTFKMLHNKQSDLFISELAVSRRHGGDRGTNEQLASFRSAVAHKTALFFHLCHDAIESKLSTFYSHLGLFCATRPWLILFVCFIITAVSAVGITRLDFTEPIEKVWIPVGSEAVHDRNDHVSNFGDFRLSMGILVGKPEGKDILYTDFLLDALRLHQLASSIVLQTPSGENFTYSDLCFKPYPSAPCMQSSILRLWGEKESEIQMDRDIHATVSRVDNTPFQIPSTSLLGGYNVTGQLIVRASAMAFAYLIKNNEGTKEKADLWETHFVNVLGRFESAHFTVYRRAPVSQAQEVQRGTKNDIPLFVITFSLMVAYISFALFRINLIRSKVTLGFCGVVGILLAIITSFGICGWLNATFSSAVLVMPFLILSIGTDDIFILMSAYERLPRGHHEQRISTALSQVGSSITLTSLTNFIAFIAGSTSPLPGISGFCLFNAVAVLIDFIYQMTLFVALLAINERRAEQNRFDCVPCIKRADQYERMNEEEMQEMTQETPQSMGEWFVRRYFGPFLLHRVTRIVMILLAIALASVSIYGTTQLEGGLTDADVLPHDTYILPFTIKVDEYFKGLEDAVDFVSGPADYHKPAVQDQLIYFHRNMTSSPYIVGTISCWMCDYLEYVKKPLPDLKDFEAMLRQSRQLLPPGSANFIENLIEMYVESIDNITVTEEGRPTTEKDFYIYLYLFLADPRGGYKYIDDIIFQFGTIKAARMQGKHITLDTDTEKAEAMITTRRQCRAYADVQIYPYSMRYLYWEQYVGMVKNNVKSYSAVAACIFLFTFFFLGDIKISILVVVSLFATMLDLLGMMWLWNIGLNNMTLTVLLLNLGLAVDACTHVGHSIHTEYRRALDRLEEDEPQPMNLRYDAIISGLSKIGPSVFSASLTSFIGVSVLGFASHELLRIMFKFFFSVFLLAMFHGLMLAPVLYSFL